MKKIISSLSLSNISSIASAKIVNLTMLIAGCAIYIDQILEMIHSAPFPVSPLVDEWIRWIIRVAGTIMVIYTAMSKKKDIDIDVKIKDVTPSETSIGELPTHGRADGLGFRSHHVNRVKHRLGTFDNYEDAVAARKAAEKQHGILYD